MEHELYFDKDDKLGRKRYAEFLRNLILNSSAFKREDERKAFSIAIDSPWGTGKSYFLNMLKNHLLDLSSDESAFDPNGPFRVVLYNAWENDCWNNAFEPLAQKLCESEGIGDLLKEDEAALQEAVRSIGVILQGIWEKAAHMVVSEQATEKLRQSMKKIYSPHLTVSEEYVKFRQSVDMLKHILSEAAKELQSRSGNPCAKIVVIIDELDRCRPDFAVQTMEFVKHLFDAENVVFLFALDMSQLRHSVKSIYGDGMDAEGYLIRFFDYYGKLIEPDIAEFIRQEIGPIRHTADRIDDFAQTARKLDLSLRDLKMILRVFIQMEKYFLHEYKSGIAHSFYFKLVCVKYKFPSQLKELLNGKETAYSQLADLLLPSTMEVLALSEPLESTNKKEFYDNNGTVTWTIEKINWKMNMVVEDTHRISCILTNATHSCQKGPKNISKTSNINGLLFYPDLKKWDQIKDLTPAQYLMQQLEMFDFFQPQNQ